MGRHFENSMTIELDERIENNRPALAQGLRVLGEQWGKIITYDLENSWVEFFWDIRVRIWLIAVKHWLANGDHFPLPVELRRVAESQKQKTDLEERYAKHKPLLTEGPPEEIKQMGLDAIAIIKTFIEKPIDNKEELYQDMARKYPGCGWE